MYRFQRYHAAHPFTFIDAFSIVLGAHPIVVAAERAHVPSRVLAVGLPSQSATLSSSGMVVLGPGTTDGEIGSGGGISTERGSRGANGGLGESGGGKGGKEGGNNGELHDDGDDDDDRRWDKFLDLEIMRSSRS
jgi:hypothetical protein